MRRLFLGFFLFVFCTTFAFAALKFPALTGRVVDDAHVLSSATIRSLEKMVEDYERGTTNQVVVVTIPSLQGTSIEDYGYQLGRYWQIGQKEKNNGALLIIAPTEHKVRIEVGYGLEPILTDAASSTIVQSVILPAFRAGHMEQGIIEGTRTILSVLGGKSIQRAAASQPDPLSDQEKFFILLFILPLFWFCMRHPFIAAFMLSGNISRFGGSGLSGSDWGGGAVFKGDEKTGTTETSYA